MRGVHPLRYLLAFLTLALFSTAASADDWPQWFGPQRDGVWREKGIVEKFPTGGPKVRWHVDCGGGYAGPAVADGKVFVIDRVLAKDTKNPANPFATTAIDGAERVLCINDKTGKVLWTHSYPCKYQVSYPAGPRCTPVVKDGKVYTLGAMGDLCCLDVANGALLWSKNFKKDYGAPTPLWGFAAHPLLDGDQLICLVGGKGSVVVAFDRNNGKELWKSLSMKRAQIGYAPPMIYKVGKTRQLIIWTPEAVNGLNPKTGAVYWTVKCVTSQNLTIPTPRLAGDKLLVTSFYNGSTLLQLDQEKPAAKVLWKAGGRGEAPSQTESLHSIISTPVIKDGYFYGVCSYGELRCLKLENGDRVWQDMRATGSEKEPTERWANAFIIPHGDRYFLFNEKGDLIIAKLTPKGYEEIDRAHIIAPTGPINGPKHRLVVWSYPAFANQSVYVRNDKEIRCLSLAAPGKKPAKQGAVEVPPLSPMAVANRAKLDQVFDKYTEKYAPKNGKTYCNVFATLATAALGSKVPQKLANHQQEWLLKEGKGEGWQQVSPAEAQKLANQGRIVVASWKNPDPAKHGHIAVVRPYADHAFSAAKGPRITQFGARNKKDVYAAETFGKKVAATKFFAQMN